MTTAKRKRGALPPIVVNPDLSATVERRVWRQLVAAACLILAPNAALAQPATPPTDEGRPEAPTDTPAQQGEPAPPTEGRAPGDDEQPEPPAEQAPTGERAEDDPDRVPEPARAPEAAEAPEPPEAPEPVPVPEANAPPEVRSANVTAPEVGNEPATLTYLLERIEIHGNTKTRSRVVLRYIPFRPGDVLDVDDPRVELTRYRLLGTGFFRDVQLSLRKGSKRGQVVLVVEVRERNTIVVNDIWMGLAADADTRGEERPLTAYAGLDVAETNLAGTGITLGSALGLAQDQLALRVRFLDPAFLGGPWMTSGMLLFNDAQDFFGNADVNFVDPDSAQPDFAVVQYKRFGGAVGLGRDLAISTQLWAHYRLESIDADLPLSASHVRGTRGERDREPLDFSILPGRSVLSTLSASLQHDTRDNPFLPTRGWLAAVTGEISLAPIGSEYPYTRIDVRASKWWRLPWKHVLSLQLFGGAIAGDAPFFEQYYVADLSDFRASRVLGLNVERRPPPNFFDTVVAEIRRGDYAAKINGVYRIPLYRGQRSVYGIDLFASAGVFGLAAKRDIVDPAGGYSGAALLPVDLTANLGFQMDTKAGGFTFAFANVLGFIPIREEN